MTRFGHLPPILKPAEPVLRDFMSCLRFYTRLPVPVLGFERDAFASFSFERAAGMLPLVGAVIGGVGALGLLVGHLLHLPATQASILCVSALVLATGAMHEDGLADCADGFGGGTSAARKLEIMRDSRIGTFGALALILSISLRIGLVATLLLHHGSWVAVLSLMAAGAVSRVAGLVPLLVLTPARADGLAARAGRPGPMTLRLMGILTLLVMLLPLLAGAGLSNLIVGLGAAIAAAYGVAKIAASQIGGHTGDVAGAAQQMAEIAFLLILAAR